MVWVIISFIVGIGIGILAARVFFPILSTKYNIVEKVVEKVVEVPKTIENSYVPKKKARKNLM